MTQKSILLTLLGLSTVGGGVGGAFYLSQDKTIKDRLIRERFKLTSTDEGYQVAFKELKRDDKFITDIKNDTNKITANSEFSDGGKALERWCNENKKLSLNEKNIDALIEKVKKYCGERPLTIGAKLGSKLLTSGWDAKFDSIKTNYSSNDTSLLEDLKALDNDLVSFDNSLKNKAVTALEKWCNKNTSKKLVEDKDDTIFTKTEKRCTNS